MCAVSIHLYQNLKHNSRTFSRAEEVSKFHPLHSTGVLTIPAKRITSHPRRDAGTRRRRARPPRPATLGGPPEAVQDGRAVLPGTRAQGDPHRIPRRTERSREDQGHQREEPRRRVACAPAGRVLVLPCNLRQEGLDDFPADSYVLKPLVYDRTVAFAHACCFVFSRRLDRFYLQYVMSFLAICALTHALISSQRLRQCWRRDGATTHCIPHFGPLTGLNRDRCKAHRGARQNGLRACEYGPWYHFRDISITLNQIAGEPLDQSVMQYGPFVMTTREEIMETLQDCKQFCRMTSMTTLTGNISICTDQQGRNGFEKAHSWKSIIGHQ